MEFSQYFMIAMFIIDWYKKEKPHEKEDQAIYGEESEASV